MIEQFVRPGSHVLRQRAQEVSPEEIASLEIQQEIERMVSVAYGEQQDRTKAIMVGLAAPQIGISRRIIAVAIGADGKGHVSDMRVYINPEIVWTSGQEDIWYEGCFSTRTEEGMVCGIVSRPHKVRVRALTPTGGIIEEEHEGYVARIFQHEIDHLEGNEFVTHIADDDNLHWVADGQFPLYRDQEAWRSWPHKYSRSQYEELKGMSPKD